MLRDNMVCTLFFALTIIVTACREPVGTSNKMYDANGIKEALNGLDPGDPEAEEILYGKEVSNKTFDWSDLDSVVPNN